MIWVHRKTGQNYEVIGQGVIEGTLQPCVMYRRHGATGATVWVRPAAEFYDGRFVCQEVQQDLRRAQGVPSPT